MILRGFRFGMLLQFAVGPVCLFVFQIASTSGFWAALPGAAAVALVDAAFILAAIWGVGALLERSPRAKVVLRVFGAVVLILFGVNTVLGAFGIHLLPSLGLAAGEGGVFWRTLLLTVSSPLTIVFWAGIFSAKIAEDGMTRVQLYWFGLGAVLSTVLFFLLVALVGDVAKSFLTGQIIAVLNALVGIVLIGFGLRTALRAGK